MATLHNAAEPGDFAELVLLPGDPLRARYIAERHLGDARLVTSVRNMLGYTGIWRGRAVSVMGTGMGIPSISIYAHELATVYGCRRLVRVGSCGALRDDLELGDVVVATAAATDSGVNRRRLGGVDLPAVADFGMLRAVIDAGDRRRPTGLRVGTVFSSDLFYRTDDELYARLVAHGVLAVEMEAAGLYGVAAATGTAALAVCTVSDHLPSGRRMSTSERETGLDAMIALVLEALA